MKPFPLKLDCALNGPGANRGRSSQKCAKTAKNRNDLGDLDFDLVTLRSWGYVDLVHTYLPYEYGHDRRSLRQSNVYFKV